MSTSALDSHVVQVQVDDSSSVTSKRRPVSRFLAHYVEMVVVMFAGMFVLMAPTGMLFGLLGTSWSRLSPAMNVFAMSLTMTVPMVGWMRVRGHSWRANIEMAASMLIPTAVVVGVLATGSVKGTLSVPEHAGMLSCMLVAMLLRRDEYTCGLKAHAA
jgi:flagellar biosynthetic protein FliP